MADKFRFKFFGISAEAEGARAIRTVSRLSALAIVAVVVISWTLAPTGVTLWRWGEAFFRLII
jgi:type IV secretory pathway TrbD component